jgi:hypothetical protein
VQVIPIHSDVQPAEKIGGHSGASAADDFCNSFGENYATSGNAQDYEVVYALIGFENFMSDSSNSSIDIVTT